MKKYLVLFIWLLGAESLLSCDICGCSVSGSYYGLFPQYRKHFIGLRTHYRTYQIKHPPLFASEQLIYSNDLSFVSEIWGKYQINKKLQGIINFPYQYNQRQENGILLSSHGFGDASLIILYNLWSTPDSTKGFFKHAWVLGGGIKIPTGKYQNSVIYKDLILPGFQIGSASWDFPLSFLYTIKRKSIGMNLEMTYQINTQNRYGYEFGNRISSAIRFFYWKFQPNFSYLPQTGISYENFGRDIKENRIVKYTGGNAVWSFYGMDIYKGRWGLGIHGWLPIYQNVGEVHVKMQPRLSTNLLFLF